MRIAILTQPLKTNYGGILQCYALKTVLDRMGHEIIVLDRQYPNPNLKTIILRLGSIAKCVIKKYMLGKKDIAIMSPWGSYYSIHNTHKASEDDEKGQLQIRRFICEHIPMTSALRSTGELAKYVASNGFDCILVGSDQVWRECYSPCIEDFFLGFLPEEDKHLKITYAASFGTADEPISSGHIDDCVRLARRFSAISVREESGVQIMKNDFGLDAKLLLDPTLLLSAEDYGKVSGTAGNCGLASYVLDENEMKDSILEEAGKALNLRQTKLRIVAGHPDAETVSTPSVERWLASIAGADFVITDSFHGCVFSIINRKPFIAIANRDRGLERFNSLLGTFGLTDRLIFSKEDFEARKERLLSPIDYAPVIDRHQQLIQDSLCWLKENLKK